MIGIDTWYNAASEPTRIAFVSGVVTIFAALLAGIISLLVMWVQARMARRAVEAQERTIFLDLVERRSAWFDRAQELWSAWMREQDGIVESVLRSQLPDTDRAMYRIAQSRREARWLFGPEVLHHLDKLEYAVRQYGDRKLKLREVNLMAEDEMRQIDTLERHANLTEAANLVYALQSQLGGVLAPYLYVGDIRLPAAT